MNNRIVVAISGGVDSAVCVKLLQAEGYEPIGVHFVMSDAGLKDADAALLTARELGIKAEVLDLREEFANNVVSYFCKEYCRGRTPNPCVICNPTVKFKHLADYADSLGIVKIATGHYARTVEKNGVTLIKKAVSAARDQSYMLCRLPQCIVSRLVMPLGEAASKEPVREAARDAGLSCSEAPDSQEICFIESGNYAEYMHANGFKGAEGNFISPEGKIVGPHLGTENYTIGQRKGLNVALNRPVYVGGFTEDGDVQLVENESLFKKGVILNDYIPFFDHSLLEGDLTVKIRSAASPALCSIDEGGNSVAKVEFALPARAPAPGQAAVVYKGDILVGSGFIEQSF